MTFEFQMWKFSVNFTTEYSYTVQQYSTSSVPQYTIYRDEVYRISDDDYRIRVIESDDTPALNLLPSSPNNSKIYLNHTTRIEPENLILTGILVEKLRLGFTSIDSDHDFTGYADIWQSQGSPSQFHTDIYQEKYFRLTPTFPQDDQGAPIDIEDAVIPVWRKTTELTSDLATQYELIRLAMQEFSQ